MIALAHGAWSLELRPELGAAVTCLTCKGRDVLRPTPDAATHPLEAASFPLVPYANRIANGAFAFDGRLVTVPPTSGFEPHALHGLGWLRPWTVVRAGSDAVDLTLVAGADADWPWAWSASHSLRLDGDGLEMTLSITNQDAAAMPAGLGLHPYFAADDQTTLTLPAGRVWITENDIPHTLAAADAVIDWRAGAALADAPFVDNAYADWSGKAHLDHADHRVTMTASANAPWVQVYAPGAGGFVCVEPVTHRPDAHNAPKGEDAGLVVLAPGQTLSMSMRITAEETAL